MDVMEAIAKAKAYVSEVFADEGIAEIELEETDFHGGEWRIGVSFSRIRPLPAVSDLSAIDLLVMAQNRGRRRLHKIIVFGPAGDVVAMKDRAWAGSDA